MPQKTELEELRGTREWILKRIEEAAYKWVDGEITDRRLAEIVFGLTNREVER